MSPQQILTSVMTRIVVDKSTDNTKPHSICFLPQYQRQRKCFFVRARGRAGAENGITRHIDVCSPVCTLIDNGKLANPADCEICSNYGKNSYRQRSDHGGQRLVSPQHFDHCHDAYTNLNQAARLFSLGYFLRLSIKQREHYFLITTGTKF